MLEDEVDELLTVDEADVRLHLLLRLRGESAERDEEAVLTRGKVTHELCNGRTANGPFRALNLDTNDRRLEPELVKVRDDVDAAVHALGRDSGSVSHRAEQIRDEVGERMALQLGGKPFQDEVTRVLLSRGRYGGDRLEAFDPLSPFGNDLVMHITVGYMLHAFVARRDNLGARRATGTLREHRAILDTPVLLPLLGTEEQSGPILRAISAAIAAGMEVVVPVHYLTEVVEVVDRVEREYVRELEADLRGGVSADLLGRMVDDEVLSLWLRAMDGGVYSTWRDFRAAALGLRERLELLGVTVREHNNTTADNVDDIERRLTVEIEANTRGRGRAQIRRDAETIAMARRRRARPDPAHGFWPGCWIITPDGQMRRVHRAMSPMDAFSITLTPSQWIGVVSTCSDAATIEDLATSAATLLSEETFLAIAGRYPVRVAMEVARALRPDGAESPIDDRLAQLSVDDLLMRQPDFDLDGDEAGAAVAAAVVARRSARQNEAFVAGTRRLEADRTAATRQAEAARAETERERGERLAEQRTHEQERGEWRDEKKRMEDEAVLSGRRAYRNVAAVLLAVVLAVAALLQVWIFAASTLVTLLVMLYLAEEWTRKVDVTAIRFLLGLGIEAVGLIAAFFVR